MNDPLDFYDPAEGWEDPERTADDESLDRHYPDGWIPSDELPRFAAGPHDVTPPGSGDPFAWDVYRHARYLQRVGRW